MIFTQELNFPHEYHSRNYKKLNSPAKVSSFSKSHVMYVSIKSDFGRTEIKTEKDPIFDNSSSGNQSSFLVDYKSS